jgi:molecular chaperone IbpA
MVTKYAMDLFNDPFFIGFNRELNRLNRAYQTNSQSYPPYNILKLEEDSYLVSIAVAGFSKDNLEITLDDRTLLVRGEIEDNTDGRKKYPEVIHNGIAGRKFTRSFALGEYMEITSAELKDGMLSLQLDRIVPEDKKPKTIKIK